jgi:gamma-glutamylaminecyclotransferase
VRRRPVGELLFVYGTLKRGGRNHALLTGQEFIGPAWTAPRYRLYLAETHPCLVEAKEEGRAVRGEVWRVDAPTLRALDEFEEVPTPFNRQAIELDDGTQVQAYLYQRDVSGFRDGGDVYTVGEA